MSTCSEKLKLWDFQLLLDKGSSSKIAMVKMKSKLKQKYFTTTAWETQAGKYTTSKIVNVHFCLPELSVTKIVTLKCLVNESTERRYNMILGRYVITAMVTYKNIYE